jgi:glycosyltransferase involved in cell wall biosynthesis
VKITVVSHDLSHNCLGRAHVLARLAETFADVSIVGPAQTGRIWEPLQDDRSIFIRKLRSRRPSVAELLDESPDLLIAVKPRAASLGAALRARRASGVPVVADVDDWEAAFCYDDWSWWLRQAIDVRTPDNFWSTLRAESTVRRADAVTVASTWLQARFGGTIIPHARDERAYPVGLDVEAMRARYGLSGHKVVLFLGSPRRHKGLADVVAALDLLGDDNILFLAVGSGNDLPARPWIRTLGNRPFAEVPELVAAADVVVLAQHDTRTARAQVPAKLFDAMAMARPLVVTDVGDLAALVGEHGVAVPARDISRLAEGIAYALAGRHRLGHGMRQRFERDFSLRAVAPTLAAVVADVVSTAEPRPDAERSAATATAGVGV